jgi:hypothetical protein
VPPCRILIYFGEMDKNQINRPKIEKQWSTEVAKQGPNVPILNGCPGKALAMSWPFEIKMIGGG